METLSWITQVSTIILVLITGYYAWITHRILNESKIASKENLRPYIAVEFITKNHIIYLHICNYGKRGAYNLKIEFNPPIDDIAILKENKEFIPDYRPLTKQPFFSPNYDIMFFLNYTTEFLKYKDKDKKYFYEVSLSYQDDDNNTYIEKIDISLDNLLYNDKVAMFDQLYFISEISKTNKEILNTLKILSNRL